jgi:hypothetical protein
VRRESTKLGPEISLPPMTPTLSLAA